MYIYIFHNQYRQVNIDIDRLRKIQMDIISDIYLYIYIYVYRIQIPGKIWIGKDRYRQIQIDIWIQIDIDGYRWIQMDIDGYRWIQEKNLRHIDRYSQIEIDIER